MSKKRKISLKGETIRIKTGCGWMYTTLNTDNEIPAETFFRLGKSGGCTSAFLEALQRICNSNLQTNVAVKELKSKIEKMKEDIQDIEKTRIAIDDTLKHIEEIEEDLSVDILIKQLKNILCPSLAISEGVEVKSCPDGIAVSLTKLLKKDVDVVEEKNGDKIKK